MSSRPAPVRGHRLFANLVRSPRKARSGPVTVNFLALPGESDQVLVAYSIGRAVGGAVVRNRWRRRLRAIAGDIADDLRPGAYLIGVSPAVRELDFHLLRERVVETMRKASEP